MATVDEPRYLTTLLGENKAFFFPVEKLLEKAIAEIIYEVSRLSDSVVDGSPKQQFPTLMARSTQMPHLASRLPNSSAPKEYGEVCAHEMSREANVMRQKLKEVLELLATALVREVKIRVSPPTDRQGAQHLRSLEFDVAASGEHLSKLQGFLARAQGIIRELAERSKDLWKDVILDHVRRTDGLAPLEDLVSPLLKTSSTQEEFWTSIQNEAQKFDFQTPDNLQRVRSTLSRQETDGLEESSRGVKSWIKGLLHDGKLLAGKIWETSANSTGTLLRRLEQGRDGISADIAKELHWDKRLEKDPKFLSAWQELQNEVYGFFQEVGDNKAAFASDATPIANLIAAIKIFPRESPIGNEAAYADAATKTLRFYVNTLTD